MTGTLSICGTPIGNLGDATVRLGEVLRSVDLIYAEDTRRTGKLLAHLGVDTPMRSYFVGNEQSRSEELASKLAAGSDLALVTDAGMPGISDPALSAVRAAVGVGAIVTVVPGPSALTAAIAVSGMPAERFVFEGFLPRSGRQRDERLDSIAVEPRTVVLFAAGSRIHDDVCALSDRCGPDRAIVIARELTKLHEEIWRGSLGEAAERFKSGVRGEVTVVVAGAPAPEPDLEFALERVRELQDAGMSLSRAVREVVAETGIRKRRLYEAALAEPN